MSLLTCHLAQPAPLSLTHIRAGERKLGERVEVLNKTDWAASMAYSEAPFVFLGIAEDIGVRANGGIGGARTAPLPALQALLNVQESPQLRGEHIALAGILECTFNAPEKPEDLRKAVEEIDQVVATLIEKFVRAGKIPIVVGGGHNNAFGLLAGSATALVKPLCAINMDAHSDFRRAEGRHSGNGFRYAFEKGYLKRYAPFGLHRNYNSASILEQLEHNTADFFPVFFEDLFITQTLSFETVLGHVFDFAAGMPTGIELDLDAIAGMLSSAQTPSGFSATQARRFIWRAATETEAVYLHLPEGVAKRDDGLESSIIGKMLAYLMTDFMRGVLGKE
jgi:formiminoglutamase